MLHHNGSGPPWQHFQGRVVTVAATWGALAILALLFGPAVAYAAALVPLGLGARAALRARKAGVWGTQAHRERRSTTATAILMAAGLFCGSYWILRDRVPPWAIGLEAGLLLHYWLLTLA